MPFDLKHEARTTFQRFIDVVIRGIDFAFCYIDDLLIASTNESKHYGISINTAKCVFGASTVHWGIRSTRKEPSLYLKKSQPPLII